MKLRSRIALSSLMLGAAALGLGQGTAAAQIMAGESTVAAECTTHSDSVNSARAAQGGNRKDGNELSAAQTKAMEASLTKAMAAKGYTKAANGSARKPGGGGAFTSANVQVYFHVITSGTAGAVTSTQISKQIAVLNARVGRHRLHLPARGNDDHQQQHLVQPRAGQQRRAFDEDGAAPGHDGRPQHLHRQPVRWPARLGHLPEGEL